MKPCAVEGCGVKVKDHETLCRWHDGEFFESPEGKRARSNLADFVRRTNAERRIDAERRNAKREG